MTAGTITDGHGRARTTITDALYPPPLPFAPRPRRLLRGGTLARRDARGAVHAGCGGSGAAGGVVRSGRSAGAAGARGGSGGRGAGSGYGLVRAVPGAGAAVSRGGDAVRRSPGAGGGAG